MGRPPAIAGRQKKMQFAADSVKSGGTPNQRIS
jgi:hypothetical protein